MPMILGIVAVTYIVMAVFGGRTEVVATWEARQKGFKNNTKRAKTEIKKAAKKKAKKKAKNGRRAA